MKNLIFILLLILPQLIIAQHLSRSVIGAGGFSSTKGAVTLQSTYGQPSVTGTEISSNGLILRQGFHQSYTIKAANTFTFIITVFPNPTNGLFFFQTNLSEESNFEFILIDSFGRDLYEGSGSGSNKIMADLTNFENGIYFLSIKTAQTTGIFKISKTL